MKNILIPTTLASDTLAVVKTAAKHACKDGCAIVLLLVCEAPEKLYATDFRNRMSSQSTQMQQDVLNHCRAAIARMPQCTLHVHHQYGVSGPLLRNLIYSKKIDLIVIAESYKMAPQKIHKCCYALLLNSKCPVLMPGAMGQGEQMCNALYLENETGTMPFLEVQRIVADNFPYRIVGSALICKTQSPEDLKPVLAETIFKNDINVLVQTRRPEKLKMLKKAKPTVNEVMGLPVLSLYEGAV